MTSLATHPVDDPNQLALYAEPIEGENLTNAFRVHCRWDAEDHGGFVDPSRVRLSLQGWADSIGCELNKRQLSALWSTATSRDGYLDNTDTWVQITGAGSRGNTNKSVRLRRWRGWVA